jgi:hypothetical protein
VTLSDEMLAFDEGRTVGGWWVRRRRLNLYAALCEYDRARRPALGRRVVRVVRDAVRFVCNLPWLVLAMAMLATGRA